MRINKGFFLTVIMMSLIIHILSPHHSLSQEVEKKAVKPIPPEELKVRFVEVNDDMGIQPKVVISGKGTTIIWYNTTDGPMHIKFERGDKVKLACAEPIHFLLQKDGTYQSDAIPFGSTASLCFIEPGSHEYTVIMATIKPFKAGINFNKYGTVDY